LSIFICRRKKNGTWFTMLRSIFYVFRITFVDIAYLMHSSFAKKTDQIPLLINNNEVPNINIQPVLHFFCVAYHRLPFCWNCCSPNMTDVPNRNFDLGYSNIRCSQTWPCPKSDLGHPNPTMVQTKIVNLEHDWIWDIQYNPKPDHVSNQPG
jgi:hypothetical protein